MACNHLPEITCMACDPRLRSRFTLPSDNVLPCPSCAALREEVARLRQECSDLSHLAANYLGELEKARELLRAKDLDIAEAMALVYSHEGAIHRATGAHTESAKRVEALEDDLAQHREAVEWALGMLDCNPSGVWWAGQFGDELRRRVEGK